MVIVVYDLSCLVTVICRLPVSLKNGSLRIQLYTEY